MPEGIQPPKTIEEVGIHLVYMSKSQDDTNTSLKELKQTLKEIQTGVVPRLEFDEHVIWGQNAIKDHELRIVALENRDRIADASVWHRIGHSLEGNFIKFVAGGLLIFLLATAYITIKYYLQSQNIPIDQVKITSK